MNKIEVVRSAFEIIEDTSYEKMLDKIETAYRICYKSEKGKDSEKFIRSKIDMEHESPLEHSVITAIMLTNRGVSHELVRHRIASYSQESTRYCNYNKDKFGNSIRIIKPSWTSEEVLGVWSSESEINKIGVNDAEKRWLKGCINSAECYFDLLNMGLTAQNARGVLNNDLATSIVVTLNIRSWRHFFKLRALGTTGKPHPDMLELSVPLLHEFSKRYPVFFDDLWDDITDIDK